MQNPVRIGTVALTSCVAMTTVSIATILGVALFGIGSGPEHWPFFAVHLLAAIGGVISGTVALVCRRWSAVVPLLLSSYVVLFQAGVLSPPRFLMWL